MLGLDVEPNLSLRGKNVVEFPPNCVDLGNDSRVQWLDLEFNSGLSLELGQLRIETDSDVWQQHDAPLMNLH